MRRYIVTALLFRDNDEFARRAHKLTIVRALDPASSNQIANHLKHLFPKVTPNEASKSLPEFINSRACGARTLKLNLLKKMSIVTSFDFQHEPSRENLVRHLVFLH